MAKSKKATNQKSKTATSKKDSVDLSKIETPQTDTLDNKLLLETIQTMVAARAKENPKAPHVGVNEVADYLTENTELKVDGKDVRRRLQKIRKKAPDYKGGKVGNVELPADSSQNPYDGPIAIQWVNRNNREKGIEYVVAPA